MIDGDNHIGLWMVAFGCAAFGFWMEANTRVGARFTGILFAMMAALVLANLGIIPHEAPAFGTIFSDILPYAIPLLLLQTSLRDLKRAGGPMLAAFALAVLATVCGVWAAASLIDFGPSSAPFAGMFAATYIGGSANFNTVILASQFQASDQLTAAIAADVLATDIQMLVLIALPGIGAVAGAFAGRAGSDDQSGSADPREQQGPLLDGVPFRLSEAALTMAVAAALVWGGNLIAEWAGAPAFGVLVTTALTLALASLAPGFCGRLRLALPFGMVVVYLFLVAIAASADLGTLAAHGAVFAAYTGLILGIHTLVVLGLGYMCRLPLATLIIASTAAVGGVSSSGAVASAKGWHGLIAPGILAGTLGNALGGFIGVAVWQLWA